MPALRLTTLVLAALAMLSPHTHAADTSPPPAAKLTSDVYHLDQLPVTPTPLGSRRAVFDGPTATLDLVHCHVTSTPANAAANPVSIARRKSSS